MKAYDDLRAELRIAITDAAKRCKITAPLDALISVLLDDHRGDFMQAIEVFDNGASIVERVEGKVEGLAAARAHILAKAAELFAADKDGEAATMRALAKSLDGAIKAARADAADKNKRYGRGVS